MTINGTTYNVIILNGRTHKITLGDLVLFDSNDYGVTMNNQDTILFLSNF